MHMYPETELEIYIYISPGGCPHRGQGLLARV